MSDRSDRSGVTAPPPDRRVANHAHRPGRTGQRQPRPAAVAVRAGARHDPAAQTDLRAKIDKVRSDYQSAACQLEERQVRQGRRRRHRQVAAQPRQGSDGSLRRLQQGRLHHRVCRAHGHLREHHPDLRRLASAGGPAGALVGALFSVVGQILSYFAPKQPSVTDKIKEMLDHVQSEAEIERITAFGSAVAVYTDGLNRKANGEHRMSDPAAVKGTVEPDAGSTDVTGTGTAFLACRRGPVADLRCRHDRHHLQDPLGAE